MAKPISAAIAKQMWIHGFETMFLHMFTQYPIVEVILHVGTSATKDGL